MNPCSLSNRIGSLMLILVLSHANPESKPKRHRKNYILTEAFPLRMPYGSVRYNIANLKVEHLDVELKEKELSLVLTNFSESTMEHLKHVVKIEARVKNVSISDTFREHVSSMESFKTILSVDHLISYSAPLLDTLIDIGPIYNKFAPYDTFAINIENENRIHLKDHPPSAEGMKTWTLLLYNKIEFNMLNCQIYSERIQ